MNIRFTPAVRTIADLLHHLGDIPPDRVRMTPVPGTATRGDLLRPENVGCELVDGTLVEKPVGQVESRLAFWLGKFLMDFAVARNLGYVTGEHGFVELPGGPVRGPDVAFIAWDQVPNRRQPSDPIPEQAPALVVEVLSISNSKAEMARKRSEYFEAGVRLVWEIDPRARTARAYTAADRFTDLAAADALDGGDVLPGFALRLADLFAELDRHG